MPRSLLWPLCLCVLAGSLLLGCGGKDGPVKVRPPDPTYVESTTPLRAILNYAMAWEKKDSVMIDSTVAVDYQGTSVDLSDPSPVVFSYYKSDEVSAVGGLAKDIDVRSVTVDFPDSSAWVVESLPVDPPDWVTITIPSARIAVDRGPDLLVADGRHEFKVKPMAAASGTRWQIIRWSEVHQP